jgi:uncharacterized membrane protein YeiB
MSQAGLNLVAFAVVMIVVPWSRIWLLRTAGGPASKTWSPARRRRSGRCTAG